VRMAVMVLGEFCPPNSEKLTEKGQ